MILYYNHFLRKFNPEDKEEVEQNVLSLYKICEKLILSDECTQDLRNELEESIPNCLTVLRKWINDLENSDHGIVIAGSVICVYFALLREGNRVQFMITFDCVPENEYVLIYSRGNKRR